jgi:ABC-type Fe3+-hydroxamate transport system substrate-binding protein
MPVFTDQLKRKVELTSQPKRIISLVPSQTELLYDLGLRDEVVGITKFCIHPDEWFRSKTRVGGTKKFDFEKIKELQPDLIIGNKEENEKGQIEELMEHYNVWMSDIYTLKDSFDMITSIGALVGKVSESVNLKLEIESKFNELLHSEMKVTEIRTAYFIWRDPYIAVGHSTFINEMMKICGFKNVFTEEGSRYPEVTYDQIQEADPKLILLSSEPYPFKEKHLEEFRQMLPEAKIRLVDGEAFSWYGSRLRNSPEYFRQLIQELSS